VKPNLLDNVFQASYTTKQDGMEPGYPSVARLAEASWPSMGNPE
jgi:hypothetical protein